jgi:hypothetical protein
MTQSSQRLEPPENPGRFKLLLAEWKDMIENQGIGDPPRIVKAIILMNAARVQRRANCYPNR